jgi:mannose-6-phosphate isomerase-like protein (cupin superfamily)
MVIRGALAMTVDDETIDLAAGTAGQIVSGTGYVLANPARAEAAFVLVHVPPAGTRARYTRARQQADDRADDTAPADRAGATAQRSSRR